VDGHRVVACVGLGSNLGDRKAALDRAVASIRALSGVHRVEVSAYQETEPVGGPPQGRFLNAAAAVETSLEAHALFDALLAIERTMGRVRGERWGPRIIDLDLLLFGDAVLDEKGLRLPHPRMCERAFVLGPLAEIAPDARHPENGCSVRELLAQLEAKSAGAGGRP